MKMLKHMDENGHDTELFKELLSTMELALRDTKMMAKSVQVLLKDARADGCSLDSMSAGPASYAAASTLAKSQCPISCLAHGSIVYIGDMRMPGCYGSLEKLGSL